MTRGNPYGYEAGFTIEQHVEELIERLGKAIKRINELEQAASPEPEPIWNNLPKSAQKAMPSSPRHHGHDGKDGKVEGADEEDDALQRTGDARQFTLAAELQRAYLKGATNRKYPDMMAEATRVLAELDRLEASPEPEPIEGTKEGREPMPPSPVMIQAMAVCDTSAALSADAPEITMSDVGKLARSYLSMLRSQPPIAAAGSPLDHFQLERLDDLEKAANAATQGQWQMSGIRTKLGTREFAKAQAHVIGPDGDGVALVLYEEKHHQQHFADAKYVAKANPAAILELIKLVRAALPSPGETK